MITVVDYGMGNLRNVRRACERIGAGAVVTADPAFVRNARSLILPGVGAFGEAMHRIDELGLRGPIIEHAASRKPLLGICLGMQLLFDSSDESPGIRGLGLIPGRVNLLNGEIKVPHIGWNDIETLSSSALFPDRGEIVVGYFVHSYYVGLIRETIACTEYGVPFSAGVRKDNVYGLQFHPEKSHAAGLEILRRFADIRPPDGLA